MARQIAELDFLPELQATMRRASGRFVNALTLSIVAFVVFFVVWAQQAVLDEVTRGDGSVIPSSRVQVIQHLEGGILSEMLVSNGDIVAKDSPLLRITNAVAQSDLQESRAQQLSLKAAMARLEAEVEDRQPVFPPEVMREAPQAVETELALFRARRTQLESQVAVIREQESQRQQEIVELKSRIQTTQRTLGLAREERAITEPLVAQGVAARVDLVRLQRQISELEGQLENSRLAIPRAEAALSEAQRRVQERQAIFKTEARNDLNQRRIQISAIEAKLGAEQDRVTRTEVRSPVRGTVKEIKINTIGGVIRPGQDLIEIVPLEDTLVVEARIRPADIAFLRPGQEATLKITAYDFSIYGGLKAKLEQISADTIKDDKGDSFFRVQLRTNRNFLGSPASPLPIIPGMTASVEILTGQKTVLDYLAKPLLKARDRALRER
ncbi:MAG TPA: HlyD family type I secretion periplasmic adaptor subunit [Alphaproteobacteria bacterium]|nr:HlyD family type I secretion periplasmic adaptor subunit [Alphaproteobacteria bacterium]